MTPEERREAWKARELSKAGALTQQQQSELRRVLLPAAPLTKPTKRTVA